MKGRKEEGESNEQTWGEARRRKQRFRKRALINRSIDSVKYASRTDPEADGRKEEWCGNET